MMCGDKGLTHLVKRAGWLVIAAGWLVILAGCARADREQDHAAAPVVTRTLVPATATPSPQPVVPATETPTDLPAPATLAAITVSDTNTADGLFPASARLLVDAITAELVADDNREPAEVRLLSLERFVWEDKSWECAVRSSSGGPTSPGPGYRMVFSAGSRIYVYHTDVHQTFFQCNDRDWLALEGEPLPLDPIAQSMVDLSVEDAAERLDVATEDLRLASLLVVDWPDSSVGCPKPGADYAEQPTTGYRIVLRTSTDRLIYHTSIRHIVKCDPTEEILPGFVRRARPDPTPTPDSAP